MLGHSRWIVFPYCPGQSLVNNATDPERLRTQPTSHHKCTNSQDWNDWYLEVVLLGAPITRSFRTTGNWNLGNWRWFTSRKFPTELAMNWYAGSWRRVAIFCWLGDLQMVHQPCESLDLFFQRCCCGTPPRTIVFNGENVLVSGRFYQQLSHGYAPPMVQHMRFARAVSATLESNILMFLLK